MTKNPKPNIDYCMAEEEYLECWHEISKCGLPKTREDSANGEVPLWEEVQAKINLQLRSLCIKGRHGHQSYVIDDHKLHIESDLENTGICQSNF